MTVKVQIKSVRSHFPQDGSIYPTHTEGLDMSVCVRVPLGGHNVTVKNTITSWWKKGITSPNPLNLVARFIQMLDDFHLIHFKRRIHPVRRAKPVMKMH